MTLGGTGLRRLAAWLWLVLVLVAGGYLLLRIHDGLAFRTDLMALLPREQQDPVRQQADDIITRSLSRQIVMLVGAPERAAARAAAGDLGSALGQPGLVQWNTGSLDKDHLTRLGQLYFPYRRGLLTAGDRQRLGTGKGEELANRALSQVFGFVGLGDAAQLAHDPFLLMTNFFSALPLPLSRLALDDGMLSLEAEGKYWVLLSGTLTGEPYALDVQKQVTGALDPAVATLQAGNPDLQVLRVGAVFFAQAGAAQAIGESTLISIASTIGTLLLVFVVFRALSPLWLTLLAIGVGVAVALSVCLFLFGELHVGALLFGVSLIGVTVDYSLQYCTEIFAPDPPPPAARLKRVLTGITLGTATTIIGYLTLMLAPFPGLHQIALFSAIGLFASWATVVLWLPALDRSRPPRHGRHMLAAAGWFIAAWEVPKYRHHRRVVLGILILAGLFGLDRIRVDDDVRRMQSLSSPLVAQQERLQHLIGSTAGSQFFLVQTPDDETALQAEEALIDRLTPLLGKALTGFQAPAHYVPSAARQRENRLLVHQQLDGDLLQRQVARLGLSAAVDPGADLDDGPVLTLPEVQASGALGFLSSLILDRDGRAVHVVTLDGVSDLNALAAAADGMPGVRFVDPAGDFSALLGKYRNRALILLALSAALMAPLLVWRYGVRRGLRVMVPPLIAVALAPALRALAGGHFTFFDAMALVLILSVGVDYAVFCAETAGERKPVTMLAVAMAAGTALLSFGLLAVSGVLVVSAFGATMAIGILLAFLLAPMARGAPSAADGAHWSELKERGAFWGIRCVVGCYFLLGRRVSLALLWPIVLYFYVTDPLRRRDSRAYLTRVYRLAGRPDPTWLDGLRHFMSFAQKALEALIAWAHPERIPLEVVGREEIGALSAQNRGGLLIVSHLGNAEVSRGRLEAYYRQPMNVLLHSKHAAQYNRVLRRVNPAIAAHVIEVTEIGPMTAIALAERVERGEWIAIAGDRTPMGAAGRTSLVPFLGSPAPFAQGPYILAALMKCPVFVLFCLRDEGGHTAYFEKFSDRIELPRRDKEACLAEHAARYAAILERYCLKAPLQWYNFFDFWAVGETVDRGGP
jgi:predicted exporter/predicted LPLAT superfamily acyltransferase